MLEILIEILKGIASIILYSWWLFLLIFIYFAWQNTRKAKWANRQESVVLEVKIPKTNDKNPTAAEMMFATLHGIYSNATSHAREGSIQQHLSFEIVADTTSIRFYVWTPKNLKDFVEGQIYAQYPTAEITQTDDYAQKHDQKTLENIHVSGAEIKLIKEDYLPIKTFNNFTVDPLAGITGVLSKLEGNGEEIWIQVLARPVSDRWKQRGLNWVNSKKGGEYFGITENFTSWIIKAPFMLIGEIIRAVVSEPSAAGNTQKKISVEDESKISAIEEKSEKLAYQVKIRVAYVAETPHKKQEKMQAVFGAFKQYNTTNLNGFRGHIILNNKSFLSDYRNRLFLEKGFYLNIEELASIYHLPHTSVETPNIKWTTARVGEPPTSLPTLKNTDPKDLSVFATTNFRSHREEFGIKRDDRRRHMYIIGKSGMGKTKLLENMINNDIKNGEGVALMDPHGDYFMSVLAKVPKERIDDVIIFDPSDVAYPVAFNPMEVTDPNFKVQIASGIVGTFKKIFGTSWGPRLEYILNYTVLALLDTPNTTLLGIVRMLTDKNYRKVIVDNIQDPVVKKFWTTEFASYNEKFATEAIAPILNKVGQFVANSLIRNVIGQPKSTFNIRDIMDQKKILLINLSTGRVGETNAALMGSLMITAIQLAAMSRADIAEENRADYYLYVDEFQNFATESFKNILSEARKYRLALIMANQYIAQMEDTGVKDAIFGNVGTMITFRVGAADANELVKEFNPPFEAQDLINIARQNIYVRMTIDGQSETAFSGVTLTVTNKDETGLTQEIINRSRAKYSKARAEVEADVAKNSGIEIKTQPSIHGTGESTVEIITQDADIKATEDNEIFEAPLVKKAGQKNKNTNAISDAIKENTSHLNKEIKEPVRATKKEDTKNTQKENSATTVEAAPAKIKDKIDKEVLSNILENIVRPSEKSENDKVTQATNDSDTSAEQKNQEKKGEHQPNADQLTGIKKLNTSEVPAKTGSTPAENKNEKIITPENFKKIKEIHPHEVVRVAKDSQPHELIEGQQVKFK